MTHYEYKVVAAPTRGVKAKGIKSVEARFSHALELLLNEMASQSWEYQRAETLPSTERAGLTSSTTKWRNVLVFRRQKVATQDSDQPALFTASRSNEETGLTIEAAALGTRKSGTQAAPQESALQGDAGQQETREDGVENTIDAPNEGTSDDGGIRCKTVG